MIPFPGACNVSVDEESWSVPGERERGGEPRLTSGSNAWTASLFDQDCVIHDPDRAKICGDDNAAVAQRKRHPAIDAEPLPQSPCARRSGRRTPAARAGRRVCSNTRVHDRARRAFVCRLLSSIVLPRAFPSPLRLFAANPLCQWREGKLPAAGLVSGVALTPRSPQHSFRD